MVNTKGWTQFRDNFFRLDYGWQVLPDILKGFWLNIRIMIICEVIILILALTLALCRALRGPAFFPIRALATIYVDVFRGLPQVLVLFLLGLGVPALRISWLPSSTLVWGGVALVVTYLANLPSASENFVISVQISSREALWEAATLIRLARFSASARSGRKSFMQGGWPGGAPIGAAPMGGPDCMGAGPAIGLGPNAPCAMAVATNARFNPKPIKAARCFIAFPLTSPIYRRGAERPINSLPISAARGHFALIEGRVLSVRESGATIYVNFGRRWTRDFSVIIPKRARGSFTAAGIDIKTLERRRIRVRGTIEQRSGPIVQAIAPEQIELID